MLSASLAKSSQSFKRAFFLPRATIQTQAFAFCSQTPPETSDELTNYEFYLNKFNDSIRKPHERMRSEEERIIEKYLNEQRFAEIIAFINRNADNTLGDIKTAAKIDEALSSNWEGLTAKQQITAAYSLAKLRQERTFGLFKAPIEKQIRAGGVESVQPQRLLMYLCGQLIARKSLRFLGKLYPRAPDRMGIYTSVFGQLDRPYRGVFSRERRHLLQYIGLLLDPLLNKREDSQGDRVRSHLETNVEAFLSAMGVQFEREVRVNGFYVDYLVRWAGREMVLEVNGNHHYTLGGKTKGMAVLRGVIVNEYAPVRYLHYIDFLLSRGHRNKQAYIEGLLEKKQVNWERERGVNNRWEVKVDQELIDSVADQ